jgi:hypothetical protein
MINEKQRTADGFWDIKQQEEEGRRHFAEQIDGCTRARNLCGKMLALKAHAGYTEMLSAVEQLEAHANALLLTTDKPEEMWRLQGRVNALKDMRGLMTNTENRISSLDSQIEMLENQRSAIFRPDGKVKSGETLNGIS